MRALQLVRRVLLLLFLLPAVAAGQDAGAGAGADVEARTDLEGLSPEELVEALGQPDRAAGARRGLMRHASEVSQVHRTLWLELVVLSATEEDAALDGEVQGLSVLLGRTLLRREASSREEVEEEMADELVEAIDAPDGGRVLPEALDLAARLVEGVCARQALDWRRTAIELDPEGPVVGRLTLRLARHLLGDIALDDPSGRTDAPEARARVREAAERLEAFIVSRPADPLAPEARHLRARALAALEGSDREEEARGDLAESDLAESNLAWTDRTGANLPLRIHTHRAEGGTP